MGTLPHQVALVSDTPSVNFSDISAVAAALQKQATRDFGSVVADQRYGQCLRQTGIGSRRLLACGRQGRYQ